MRSGVTTLLFACLLILAGRAIGRRAALTGALGWVAAGMSAVVLLHLWLSLLDVLHWRWSAPLILLPLAILAGRELVSMRLERPRLPAPGWGDVVAGAIVVVFGVLAWTRWIGFADIMFHWGIKAHRFALVRHVDYAWLALPQNWVIVPHYPLAYADLLGATALVSGAWDEAGLFLWSAVFLAMLLVCVREALAMGGVAARRRQLLVVIVTAAVAGFGIGHLMAGSPDWIIALAITAALPGFLVEATPRSDLYLGICAAFAASAKAEGVPLAAWLLAAQSCRHLAQRRLPTLRGAAALYGPTTLVLCHWWWRVAQYDLKSAIYPSVLSLEKARIALTTLVSAQHHAWHGLAWLLWLIPLLAIKARVRVFVAVVLLQAGLYAWAYAAQQADTRLLVLTSFERLQLHLLPAVVAAAAVAWLGDAPRMPDTELA